MENYQTAENNMYTIYWRSQQNLKVVHFSIKQISTNAAPLFLASIIQQNF